MAGSVFLSSLVVAPKEKAGLFAFAVAPNKLLLVLALPVELGVVLLPPPKFKPPKTGFVVLLLVLLLNKDEEPNVFPPAVPLLFVC